MKFEISERITTGVDRDHVEELVIEQFKTFSKWVYVGNGGIIIAQGIQTTFGSIQRTEKALIDIREAEGGYLIVVSLEYKPSPLFWMFFLLGLFGYLVGCLIPVVFYLYHKRIVTSAVEGGLARIENELRQTPGAMHHHSTADEIAKLASLRDRGVLTEDEFHASKQRLLNL